MGLAQARPNYDGDGDDGDCDDDAAISLVNYVTYTLSCIPKAYHT